MSHKTIRDFGQGDDPETLSVSAYWILAVWRQKNPVSFSRQNQASFSTDMSKSVEVFSKPLIITDDCFSLTVSSTKDNHISNLNAGLYPGEDYLQLINPGDWACAWMVQNEAVYSDILDNLKAGKRCNRFEDGFKFFGKISDIRRQLIQDPNGPRKVRYVCSGVSFAEFDATLYYNPYLAIKEDGLAVQFGRIGFDINSLIDQNRGGITADNAVPAIVDVLLGKGIPPNLRKSDVTLDPELNPKITYGTEGDAAYILPLPVTTTIGHQFSTKKAGIGYADIVEVVIGIQQYPNGLSPGVDDMSQSQIDRPSNWISAARTFQPSGTELPGSRRYCDNRHLMGAFLPTPPSFSNRTVWNVLKEYINPATTEIYSCLRTNGDGEVVPTVILRQLPFTSDLANISVPVTKFTELPRWEIHPLLIRGADVGRSDSLRINFVEILPISSAAAQRKPTALTVTFPPRFDALDIARSGLRPYNCTVQAYAGESWNDGTKNWKDLMTDILMGQHMTFTGTMTTVGIPSPICIGDNLEFEGVIYHIQSVSHQCAIGENGTKSFNTSLSLTHGVNANQSASTLLTTNDQALDLTIYPFTSSLDSSDQGIYNPVVNSDSTQQTETPETRDDNFETVQKKDEPSILKTPYFNIF